MEKIYKYDKKWKLLLLAFAIIIGGLSLLYTNGLMKELRKEEYNRIELWSKATQDFISSEPKADISFLFEVLENNKTIPVILVDADDESIISYKNLDSTSMERPSYAKKKLEEFKHNGKETFLLKAPNGKILNKIYYSDSLILKKLQYYPYIQLILITAFIVMAYMVFNISKKAEQNHVWLGMSKETAHQLGTPLSSLMAWLEIMREEYGNTEMFKEIEKDVSRLEKITARFSKIGSQPKLKDSILNECIKTSIEYLCSRVPATIQIESNIYKIQDIKIPLNIELFEWVIENICKNAVDAIGTSGKITITVIEKENDVYIDISDTGKGISKSAFSNVFKPGFTTKSRGWGLGLSLVKRIVEEYHKGKVFVKSSEIGKGTTFRIILNKKIAKK